MSPENYSIEQRADIEKRVAEANQFLQGLKLRPAVMMQPVNIGNDVFGLKPVVYLADERYTPTASPLTP